jgi:hypothetical protein
LAEILKQWRPIVPEDPGAHVFGVDELREAMRRGQLVTHFQP